MKGASDALWLIAWDWFALAAGWVALAVLASAATLGIVYVGLRVVLLMRELKRRQRREE